MKKRDIVFIAAKEKFDFIYDGIKGLGFNIMIPYKDYNILMRILREIWFRLRLPGKKIWFNPQIQKFEYKTIIIKDSLICSELLEYIRYNNPHAKIVVMYFNREKTTFPASEAAKFADELWSYDEDDCKEYNMRHMGIYYFSNYKIIPYQNPKYDVVYLGRDKGRAEEILKIEKQLNKLGLKTYFHISPDRSFLRFKKKYYKAVIPYGKYMEILKDTRALLNIMPKGQNSITPRDMEVVFDGIKGITNNRGIKNFQYYDKNRYFILGERPMSEVKDFLETQIPHVEDETLRTMEFDKMVLNMLE